MSALERDAPGRGSPGQPNVRGILARVAVGRAQSNGKEPGRAQKHGAYAGSVVPAKPAQFLRSPAWLPLPGTVPVLLEALGEGQCHWPVTLPGAPRQHFCASVTDGGDYCPHHAKRSRAAPAEVAAHRKLLRSIVTGNEH